MVAVIKTGSSIKKPLQYNEQKMKQDVALLIHSKNYLKATHQLSFSDKINTLEKLIRLNTRARLNSVHISLNFDPSEKLEKEALAKIADTYMQQIGFGSQPYLVYQHHDAGHPHIHIVTTNIQENGKAIKMFNIGRNQSEKARKAIEKEFNLVEAQHKQLKQVYEIKQVNIQKVQYGKSATKRAITNVLDAILPTYKYASLPELNAVLRQYNVQAERGSETSRTYKNNGLVYRVLNEKGQKIGAPIKASAIYNKPGWPFLQAKFVQNEGLKQPHKIRVKNAIEFSFIRKPSQSLHEFAEALQKERIQLIFRQNDQGVIYGLTYIDQQSKCVFNGSDLGKQFSSNAIQQRCNQKESVSQRHSFLQQKPAAEPHASQKPFTNLLKGTTSPGLLEDLMQPEDPGALSPELREDNRRKKKKRIRH